jgi:hypothetical protein
MPTKKINFLIAERRNIDRGTTARDADVSDDFRALLEDLDQDIYEGSFSVEHFTFDVFSSLTEIGKMVRDQSFDYLIFYKLFGKSYRVDNVIRDAAEKSTDGKGPICLITYCGRQVDINQVLGAKGQQLELFGPYESALRSAWELSLQIPGVILTPLQEMAHIASFMLKVDAENYESLARRKAAFFDPDKGFVDTSGFIDKSLQAKIDAEQKSGLLGRFKKK